MKIFLILCLLFSANIIRAEPSLENVLFQVFSQELELSNEKNVCLSLKKKLSPEQARLREFRDIYIEKELPLKAELNSLDIAAIANDRIAVLALLS